MTAASTSLSSADLQPIRRWLQFNICVLCILAAIVFGVAEASPLALVGVPIALIGLLFVDRQDRQGLSPLWANLLGAGAFVAAGIEFFGDGEGRLLGFGHLLCYLTWIMMLQRKGNARFWLLCALSVLQIATASVLTNALWFPLAAMLYMLLGLWTLSIFSLDRAVAQASSVQSARRTGDDAPDSAQPPDDSSRSRSRVRSESVTLWMTPRFVLGVLLNGALSLLLGLAIFILTPRIWAGGLQLFGDTAAADTQPLTGFAEEVSLGDMGEILENPNLVLEVNFYSDQTGERLDVEQTSGELGYSAPLFRGKVLGRYSQGRWSPPVLTVPLRRSSIPRRVPLLRQEIRLHPIGTRILFAADRALACRSDSDVDIEHELFSDTFTCDSSSETRRVLQQEFNYVAYSSLTGEAPRLSRSTRGIQLRGSYQRAMLELPENLQRLQQLSRDLIRTQDATILSQPQIAARLVEYLRSSGTFRYSLNVSIDDPTIDPVEDFLFNRQQGHCEYFASALALMLRSVDIPARLVSGFKGGEQNRTTGYFEVRQLHAHAWVEALIDGEWVVLDATPASRDDALAEMTTSIGPITRLRQRLQAWWSHGLMMNQAQQRRLIYQPLQELFRGWVDSVRRVGLLQTMATWLRELRANPEEWISLPGFATAFTLLLLLASIIWLVRRCWRLLAGWSRTGHDRQQQRRQLVEFYERFRRLVARQGYVRDRATTQHEFATRIESDWQQRPDVDGLAQLPTRLTDAFYQVRFGRQPLPDEELQGLEASLGRLEAWMRSGSPADR